MGRTNYILIAIGLGACLAMSLVMQHALELRSEREAGPILSQLTEEFGARLDGPSRFEMRRYDAVQVAEVHIQPGLSVAREGLVLAVGRRVWELVEGQHDLGAVVVHCTGLGRPRRYQVAAPRSASTPVRRLVGGEPPRFERVAEPRRASRDTAPTAAPESKSAADPRAATGRDSAPGPAVVEPAETAAPPRSAPPPRPPAGRR